jgi:hypothetical protein
MALGNSNPPKKGQEWWTTICLHSATTGRILTAPNIAAGDFTVVVDHVDFGNLDTLPDVEPDGSNTVRLTLSAAEMDGHTVCVKCIDQTAPPEWEDFWFTIETTA